MSSQRMPAVQRQVTFRANPDVVAQQIGGDVVLVHLQTNQIYELNRTGARLWELVKAGHDRAELQAKLGAEFEVDDEQLAAEVDSFLTLLMREQLITAAEPGSDERE